ncbi:thioesterase II family protein [Streptomyces sp. NBC_00096]|uniref:thioesterase II family protein n=1 Tax=Streptomyces sp. NBC_00096 TaxID=2975650 RepID=UPI003252BB35
MSGHPAPPLLLCFHHAGAGISAFSRWQAQFAAEAEVVPVLLPGRDARVREPRVTGRAALLAELEVAAALTRGRPYLLYGHSLGGLVAYSFAAAREAAGDPPRAVVIGAVLPPHLRSPLALSAELPDTPLLHLLVRQGVLPPEAADEDRGSDLFRRRVLPPLRDDLRLAQDLIRRADVPLRAPVVAVAGAEDPVAPPEGVAQWARYAAGDFRLRTVPGGHLFVRDKTLPGLLRAELGGILAGLRPESSAV